MGQWKWAGFEVIEDWADNSDDATAQQVYTAMFLAVDEDNPGEPVPFSKTGSLRVIRTASAEIYFHASEPGGPSGPGTLYLSRVVDI
ncbi:MAG: hypothetical protein F4153_07210 [Acidimicrobiia bacterium]|nr:hypothetical protein [Acidimicrobiia bacterium]